MVQELLLGVNIDHSATIRQARYRTESATVGGNIEPDPVAVAQLAERSGADAITLHLREDRRHIQDEDVRRLRVCKTTRMNLEMACTEEMVAFAKEILPECVLLVPEGRTEVTTEGGLDVAGQMDRVVSTVEELQGLGIEVSLFIDPDEEQIRASADARATMVELHTGPFAHAHSRSAIEDEVIRLVSTANLGNDLGLLVNAGHGINYHNILSLLRVPHLHELNIGHSIISRAVFVGMGEAVREMKQIMLRYRR